MFNLPSSPISIQVYINDLITICIATSYWIPPEIHAVPLILDAIFRPNTSSELHQCNPILAPTKLEEEGILSERQIVLGWLINTRHLCIFFPHDKDHHLLLHLTDLLHVATKRIPVKKKVLESVIGKLNDVSRIVLEGHFFLNRLRYCLKVLPRKNGFHFFDDEDAKDLRLWMVIIQRISENNIG